MDELYQIMFKLIILSQIGANIYQNIILWSTVDWQDQGLKYIQMERSAMAAKQRLGGSIACLEFIALCLM